MIKSFNKFLNSNSINESIDLTPGKFAIIRVGGSIGSSGSYPVMIGGSLGTVIETSDDKEALKEKAKEKRKSLTPGERKYYKMGYHVIELTPYKIKEIKSLQDIHSKSKDSTVD